MVDLYDRADSPDEARKLVAITLATVVGEQTGHSCAKWALRALSEHGALLVQHEPLQMLVASCVTAKDVEDKYDEVIAAIDRFTLECDAYCAGDPVEIAFRRIQLFQVIAPFIAGLMRGGHCAKAVAATAAWFSVPEERRRTSPTLALLAGAKEGVVYSVEDRPLTIPRDSTETHRDLVEAMNHSFDMNIVVPDDHSFPSRTSVGRRGERGRFADELADATAAYYEVDRAASLIRETQGLALFQASSIGAPLVPLVHSRLGITWPIITSFEQPAADRPIRKALIWSYGTILGGLEARAVASILETSGVECSLLADRELTRDEFLRIYSDESLDLLWVTAHGMFGPREPQRAHFEISRDRSQPMFVTDLVRCEVPGPGRRLLFLNICLGASVAVIDAPTKLGLAALLAVAEQAVISHIVEVSSFVAPLFGVGTAIALGRRRSFLDAFSHTLDVVRMERDAAYEQVNALAPQCLEFLDWLKNGTYGVEPDDIRTWGTGAFYE